MNNYFIIVNGAQQGPFSIAELQQRGISSETLVWTEGMAEWTPAWQVEELRPIFYKQTAGPAVPPPPPGPFAEGAQWTQAAGTPLPQGAPAGPAGPAGTQPGSGQPAAKRRHNGRWAIIVLVVVALLLAFTNPSEKAHKRAILSNVTNGVSQVMDNGDANPLTQGLMAVGRMFAGGMVQMVLEQNLEYHNYLFFSTTSLHIGSQDVRTSMGFLGNVFTASKDDVAKKLAKAISEGSGDDEASDAAADSDQDSDPDVQVQSNEQDSILTDETGRAIGRAVVKEVTKTVKKKVSESTDSATSTGVSHVIDEIEKMIGL